MTRAMEAAYGIDDVLDFFQEDGVGIETAYMFLDADDEEPTDCAEISGSGVRYECEVWSNDWSFDTFRFSVTGSAEQARFVCAAIMVAARW